MCSRGRSPPVGPTIARVVIVVLTVRTPSSAHPVPFPSSGPVRSGRLSRALPAGRSASQGDLRHATRLRRRLVRGRSRPWRRCGRRIGSCRCPARLATRRRTSQNPLDREIRWPAKKPLPLWSMKTFHRCPALPPRTASLTLREPPSRATDNLHPLGPLQAPCRTVATSRAATGPVMTTSEMRARRTGHAHAPPITSRLHGTGKRASRGRVAQRDFGRATRRADRTSHRALRRDRSARPTAPPACDP